MNEQTPESQQPHDSTERALGAHDPTPRAPERPSDSPEGAAAGADDAAVTTGSGKRRGILRPVLIGSAAALAVLVVAGVGMTVADAIGDDDESPAAPDSSAPLTSGAPTPTDASRPSSGDEADGGAAASSDPSSLQSAIETAIAAAGGGAATSIEVEQGAWSVDVQLEDGSELDIRVPVSGDAVVREDDDDDRSTDLPLEPARIPDIVDAAVAAAGGGIVTSIETEEGQVRYEVEVSRNGEDVDVDLAEDLTVLSVDP